MRRVRVAAVAVAAAFAGCSSAAARSPATTAPATTPSARSAATEPTSSVRNARGGVYMLGDSLTVGVEPFLAQFVSGRSVDIDAKNGRTLTDGLAIVKARTAPIPPTVVVALGTNGQESASQFSADVDQMMTLLGGRRVIWVNLARPLTGTALNDELNGAKGRHANLEILDWASIIAAHPEDLLPDGIHCTQPGYQLRARFIAAKVNDQS